MALTEHDIFKLCVKEPLFTAETQNALHRTGRPTHDASDGMQLVGSGDNGAIENRDVQRYCLKLILKVWNGFGKFLNHQIHNNRCVNTIHLGKFMPAQGKSPGVCFIPSTQFLDASRLLYKEDAEFNLNPFSDIKLRQVQVSLTSLGQVCNAPKETVSAILKEIFHKIAERGRLGVELKIDLRIGFIHIFNGELEFINIGGEALLRGESRKSGNHLRAFSQHSDYSLRQKMRKGSASVMASSVHTPFSNMSQTSRISQVASHFADYISPSNPNPQFGKMRYGGLSPDGKKPGLPWPHLAGFIESGIPKWEGKRVNVSPKLSRRELLQEYLRNMKENEKKKYIEKQNHRQEDQNLMNNVKENIVLDNYLRAAAESKRRDEFLLYNGTSKQEHESQKSEELLQKKLERYDYFPFTHGYEIERKQKELNQKRKEEMKKHIEVSQGKRTAKRHKGHSIGDASQISLSQSNPHPMPLSFYADYPIFLKPHKHYPYRRMKDGHVEDVMNDALQRYEQQLVSLEDQKKRDAFQFQQQLAVERQKDQQKEENSRIMREENKGVLLRQIQLERERKKLDKEAKKELVRTNFGPEETDHTQGQQAEKKQQQLGHMKEDLLNQIVLKQAKKKAELQRNRLQEVEQLISAAQVMEKERNELLDKEAQSRQGERTVRKLNEHTWKEQMKLNQIKKKIEKKFNS